MCVWKGFRITYRVSQVSWSKLWPNIYASRLANKSLLLRYFARPISRKTSPPSSYRRRSEHFFIVIVIVIVLKPSQTSKVLSAKSGQHIEIELSQQILALEEFSSTHFPKHFAPIVWSAPVRPLLMWHAEAPYTTIPSVSADQGSQSHFWQYENPLLDRATDLGFEIALELPLAQIGISIFDFRLSRQSCFPPFGKGMVADELASIESGESKDRNVLLSILSRGKYDQDKHNCILSKLFTDPMSEGICKSPRP
jgi:hypothetical protein